MKPRAWSASAALAQIVVGLAVIVLSETATLARIEPFWSWNTPICWTGFILFADGVVWRARAESWLHSAPREFAGLALLSIPLWLVFEFYNRFIRNWYYVGLPENAALRYFGYAWSYATIWPAIFEAAELVAVLRAGKAGRAGEAGTAGKAAASPAHPAPPSWFVALGAALLVWPLVWPSQYLAAPVWLGFIFLLDPINARLTGESLLKELREGPRRRIVNLAVSGLVCGLLWEFWNYWSRAKWHYSVPIMQNIKIFEMPVPGYLGFPPFAFECFTMYVFVRASTSRLIAGTQLGRTIAL
jgi:hypothetical protein